MSAPSKRSAIAIASGPQTIRNPNRRSTKLRPEAALRAKVEDYLRQSRALELWRARAITADELQAEVERMAQQTRLPGLLGELWAALAHDPLLTE